MTPDDSSETFTYRGRSLEELVPRIRQELGDDAVIVARRETSSGGVGGFFARREIEVEVRPGGDWIPPALPPAAAPLPQADIAAFAQQLADAQQRQDVGRAGGEDVFVPRPATAPEIDAIPVPPTHDVTVDDLFPAAPPPQVEGLAALFNAGRETQAPPSEPVEPAEPAEPEPVEPEPAAEVEPGPEPELPRALEPELPRALEPEPEDQPTGVFDYLGVGETVGSALPLSEPEVVEPEVVAPEPEPEPEPEPVPAEPELEAVVEPELEPEPEPAPAPPAPVSRALPAEAQAAVDRMVARGLRQGLAEAIAEEAIASLLPLDPAAEPRHLVVDALARRIPVHPLRRGPAVVGFVGPGGAGKTRCAARLAAAHARHGALAVTVIALRAPDGGAELTRLLAPYDVDLIAVETGAEGAGRIAALRGERLVIVDTPGVSPRSPGELRALGDELRALAPDELHLTVSATIGPAAAGELVGGVRELGVGAVVVTHVDETEILGTVIGLAIDTGLPLSYLARGQAVDAGLQPASPAALAGDLIPS